MKIYYVLLFVCLGLAVQASEDEFASLKDVRGEYKFLDGDLVKVHAIGDIASDDFSNLMRLKSLSININNRLLKPELFQKIYSVVDGVKLETLEVSRSRLSTESSYVYTVRFDYLVQSFEGLKSTNQGGKKTLRIDIEGERISFSDEK